MTSFLLSFLFQPFCRCVNVLSQKSHLNCFSLCCTRGYNLTIFFTFCFEFATVLFFWLWSHMKLTNLAFLRNSWLNTAITKQKHLGLHNFRLCYSCVLRLRPQRNLVLTLSKNFIVTFKMAAGRPKILQISNYCLEFSVLQIGKKVSKPALGVPKLSLISCQALSVPDTVTLT